VVFNYFWGKWREANCLPYEIPRILIEQGGFPSFIQKPWERTVFILTFLSFLVPLFFKKAEGVRGKALRRAEPFFSKKGFAFRGFPAKKGKEGTKA